MALPGFGWTEAQFKSSLTPLDVQRDTRKAARQKALDAAYAIVDKRESNVCQASGASLRPGAVDARVRREHHHIKGRRVRPEWREDADRIVLVSALAHGLITTGWLVVEGERAGKVRFHWAEHVRPDQKPFRLKSRRWSQTI